MKHRHLNHEDFTLAAIEDILGRGSIPDWVPLLEAIDREPYGEIADRVDRICRARPDIYGSAKLFQRVLACARASTGESELRRLRGRPHRSRQPTDSPESMQQASQSGRLR